MGQIDLFNMATEKPKSDKNYVKKYHINELTPVEKVGDIFFKRDDLYMPFDDIPLSGGKVRQCIALLGDNREYIKEQLNSSVISGTNMSSPQGIIISRVAREFGFDSTICIGGSSPNGIANSVLMQNIIKQGGKLDTYAKLGYENNLEVAMNRIIESSPKFKIKFGINIDSDPDAILDSVSYQVQNLPKDLDYLIVPCGSCIMFSGILLGLDKYDIHPKHVVGIQIAGYDRTKTIDDILDGRNIPYEFYLSKDYNYHKPLKLFAGNIELDWLYESKAYDYMNRYLAKEIEGKKTCFWLVGNSTAVRTKIY